MSPQHARGAALVVLLMLLPGALASHDPSRPLDVHKPDLFPGSLRWTVQDERQPTTACLEIYNLGVTQQALAGFFDVQIRVHRVVNNTLFLQKEDFRRTTEPIAGGKYVSMCFTFQLEAGDYLGAVVVDVADEVDEEVETNNAHHRGYMTEVPSRPRPNLAIMRGGLLVTPQDAREGFPQYFRVRIVNLGEEASPDTTVAIRDETGLLSTLPLRALSRGEYTEVVFSNDPSIRAAGTYNAIAVVDPDDVVEESNELDNSATRAYSVPPHPLPDLIVRDVVVNGTLLERRALRLEVNVSNVGNKTAGTSTFRFEIDGVSAANHTVDRIATGANVTLSFPFYLTAGNHTLRVIADPTLGLAELDESNNAMAVFVSVDTLPQEIRRPNLVIDRLSALPDDPGPGEVVTINTYVRNIGEMPSGNATLALVLDGLRIADVRVPPIQPDRYHSALFEWTNVTVGPHVLRAYVDAGAELAEIHEDDNNETLFFTIQPPRVQSAPSNYTPPLLPPAETPPPTPPENETRETPPKPAQNETRERRPMEITQMSVTTRPVEGGVKGRIAVSIRNPNLEPVGRLTVSFLVDGQPLKQVLVDGIPAAGITGTTSGEVDLPPGDHRVEVEVRPVGGLAEPVKATDAYSQQAGEKATPGPSVALAIVAALGALAARRRKADD